jgi:hypothetical protein
VSNVKKINHVLPLYQNNVNGVYSSLKCTLLIHEDCDISMTFYFQNKNKTSILLLLTVINSHFSPL